MYILLAVAGVLVAWLVFKPAWAPKPPDTKVLGEKASQFSKTATEKAGLFTKTATDKAGQFSKTAVEKAGEFSKTAGTKAGEFSKAATEKAGELSKTAGSKAGELSKTATEKAGEFSKAAAEQTSRVSKTAVVQAGKFSKQASARASELYGGVRGRLKLITDRRNLAKQYRQWVADMPISRRTQLLAGVPTSADNFTDWLTELNEKQVENFSNKVAQFCVGLNIDIGWLTTAQLNYDPGLKQAVEDAVLLYSLAHWHAGQVQREVKAFLAYQAWLDAPMQHKEFGHRLHARLLSKGLVTVEPQMYLATEKEREKDAIESIHRVAGDNTAVFTAILRDLDEPESKVASKEIIVEAESTRQRKSRKATATS
ncbi:MAG: hypothetical protein HY070_13255 [Chloroflexi bacterium]|nr:hypothetical protein [Chloroflexota bacterium]